MKETGKVAAAPPRPPTHILPWVVPGGVEGDEVPSPPGSSAVVHARTVKVPAAPTDAHQWHRPS